MRRAPAKGWEQEKTGLVARFLGWNRMEIADVKLTSSGAVGMQAPRKVHKQGEELTMKALVPPH